MHVHVNISLPQPQIGMTTICVIYYGTLDISLRQIYKQTIITCQVSLYILTNLYAIEVLYMCSSHSANSILIKFSLNLEVQKFKKYFTDFHPSPYSHVDSRYIQVIYRVKIFQCDSHIICFKYIIDTINMLRGLSPLSRQIHDYLERYKIEVQPVPIKNHGFYEGRFHSYLSAVNVMS